LAPFGDMSCRGSNRLEWGRLCEARWRAVLCRKSDDVVLGVIFLMKGGRKYWVCDDVWEDPLHPVVQAGQKKPVLGKAQNRCRAKEPGA